jgi:hypothetical protein
MIVGYIGVFFGKLIKSAISRQREFLADAAAVQFTRNPAGLSGALKKISRKIAGSRVLNPHAEEASHFFFVNALSPSLMQLFSSHPPLAERIRRIQMDYRSWPVMDQTAPEAKPTAGLTSALSSQAVASPGRMALQPRQFIGLVGTLPPGQAAQTRQWVENLEPSIKTAVREPLGARALICCLLINKEDSLRRKQLQGLQATAEAALLNELKRLWPLSNHLEKQYRLPLLDMALPALKTMSAAQYRVFRGQVRDLIAADKRIDLFEYVVQNLLTGRLDLFFKLAQPKKIRYYILEQVKMECFELLSVLAWQGNPQAPAAQEAFQKGLQALGAKQSFTILAKEKCDLPCLERALRRLSETSAPIKKAVLQACLVCISCDDMVTLTEAELLRAIAHHLDCPVPPILPGMIPDR